MTVKEFWHLKYGTIVEDVVYKDEIAWRGKVVKREVIDEVCGIQFSTRENKIVSENWLKTGKKLLEITFDVGHGFSRYVATDRLDKIKNLQVCDQNKELSPWGQ